MKIITWVVGLFAAYIACTFLLLLAAIWFEKVAVVYEKYVIPDLAVVYGDQMLFGDISFSGVKFDQGDLFSDRTPEKPVDVDEVEVWLFVLETFKDLNKFDYAEATGQNLRDFSKYREGHPHFAQSYEVVANNSFPWIHYRRKRVLIVDKEFMDTIRHDCIVKVLNSRLKDGKLSSMEQDCQRVTSTSSN